MRLFLFIKSTVLSWKDDNCVIQVIYDILKQQITKLWQLVIPIRWQRKMDQNMFLQNMSIMNDKY